jgi:hypothetical protein
MPLSEDQRALLRLLLAGDSYQQIAEVVGTTPDEVRARAQEAATGMAEETLNGHSAAEVHQRLRELNGVEAASPSTPVGSRPAGQGLPRAVRVIAAAAAVVVFVAVVAITQLGGGGDDEVQVTAPEQEDVINVDLTPVGDSRASGTAAIVRVADLPAVDLDARGLAPVGPGETYVLWLLGSGDRGIPLAFRAVGPDGRFVGRTQIPTGAAGLLPSFDEIDVSLVPRRAAAAAVNEAARSRTLPEHLGTTVLRGALRG